MSHRPFAHRCVEHAPGRHLSCPGAPSSTVEQRILNPQVPGFESGGAHQGSLSGHRPVRPDAGNTVLESLRKFLDILNGAFPDMGADGGTGKKIIDSACRTTEQLVGTSIHLAQRTVKVGQDGSASS